MTKQQYLNYKRTNQMAIIYEYYKENFDSKKHKPFLSEGEFFPYIQMISNLNEIYINVCNHYDSLYNVITIMDAQGTIISHS